VHGIVPGGGLSPDGERWIACRPGFFLPVRVLSRLFRRRFLEALADAHRRGQLQFFGEYTAVTFRWKDYRATGRTRYKAMTLEAGEFMRRFLLHVLPSGFHRIRHYGLLANPVRLSNLAKVRELLEVVPEVRIQPDDPRDAVPVVFVCRHCGAPMIVIDILQRTAPIRASPISPVET
jgi:hypothetical protein